jgi:hypothetical protein
MFDLKARERAALEREETERQVFAEWGIAPGQVYLYRSRLIKIVSVTLIPSKASWIACDAQGNPLQKTSEEKRSCSYAIKFQSFGPRNRSHLSRVL